MRSFTLPILSAVVLLSSCSVYRSGQTPDDVYYSPARQKAAPAYVQADGGRDDGRRYNNRNSYSGYDDFATADDRWLMMRVRNRYRWSIFDDYNYYSPYSSWGWGGFYPGMYMGGGFYNNFYNPWGFSYYNHFNNYWNWNSFYNPYYPNIIVVNPKTNPAGYNTVRNFNLRSYNNNTYNNRSSLNRSNEFRSRFNNSNYNNRTGNTNRRVYSNSRTETRQRPTYSTPSQDRPVRTYSPSNNNNSPSYSPRSSGSNSSSGSSSGSSGGSGSRPSRR